MQNRLEQTWSTSGGKLLISLSTVSLLCRYLICSDGQQSGPALMICENNCILQPPRMNHFMHYLSVPPQWPLMLMVFCRHYHCIELDTFQAFLFFFSLFHFFFTTKMDHLCNSSSVKYSKNTKLCHTLICALFLFIITSVAQWIKHPWERCECFNYTNIIKWVSVNCIISHHLPRNDGRSTQVWCTMTTFVWTQSHAFPDSWWEHFDVVFLW